MNGVIAAKEDGAASEEQGMNEAGGMSLEGKTVLCLATQEWDAHWTPVQQVMLRLSATNRVIYVEPFHPAFAWLRKSNSALRRARSEETPRIREVARNLTVYRPSHRYLPFNMKSRLAHAVNSYLYLREMRSLLRNLRAGNVVLWAFFAQSLSVLDLPFDFFVYDCVDDWESFFPNPQERAFVAATDEQMCRKATVVFVGSEPLLKKKARFNPNTYVVNHAADIKHFMKAADPATEVPPDLAALPTPRLGFVGMIDVVRFDAQLIAALADATDAHIVIIGGAMRGAEQLLPAHPRIHWLGMRSVEELPRYLRGMDVLLMPYKLNEATRNIYPLKLFEYLATGKPVVATAIPAVEPMRDLLYVSDSPDDFLRNVSTALAERDEDLAARRIKRATNHTWESHVHRKLELLQRLPRSEAPEIGAAALHRT
jgi:glycosyltransferase involved in cell wall biosynthesis